MPADSELTVVFVPGAWLGGWSWLPAARRFIDTGARVLTPTLPGLAPGDTRPDLRLADAVDSLVEHVTTRDLRDVVLVCHSWGGYPATGAAHRSGGRVRKVVYYNAVVPARGQSMADENEVYGELIRQAAQGADRQVPLDFDAVRHGLMPEASDELARLVFAMSVPQPGGYMTESLDVGPVTDAGVAAAYVLGAGDTALARPGAEFAARVGVETVVVPGDHMAMFTRPDDIAPALIDACA